jgi:hypothetical protein
MIDSGKDSEIDTDSERSLSQKYKECRTLNISTTQDFKRVRFGVPTTATTCESSSKNFFGRNQSTIEDKQTTPDIKPRKYLSTAKSLKLKENQNFSISCSNLRDCAESVENQSGIDSEQDIMFNFNLDFSTEKIANSPRFMKRLFNSKKYTNRLAIRSNCFKTVSEIDGKKPIRVKIISSQENSQSTTRNEHRREISSLSLMAKTCGDMDFSSKQQSKKNFNIRKFGS